MATAVLLVRLNGGSPQSGGITASAGDVVQLVAQSYAGWGSPAARWEILTYPPSWPTPSGWTLDASSGIIYYLGVTPPSFTLPSSVDVTAGMFGVWRLALTVNGGGRADLIDQHRTAIEVESDSGVKDIGYGEGHEFDSKFAYASKIQVNNRILDTYVGASFTLGSATPPTILSTTGAAGASTNAARENHSHQLTETVFRAVGALMSASFGVNNQRITSVGTPSVDTDATTKGYEDAREYASPYKIFVRGASLGNQTLSGALTEDGVTYVTGDFYLAKDQSTPSQNGVYLVNTSGSWARQIFMSSSAKLANGAVVGVREGTTNGSTGWILSTPAPIVLDTTALTFTKVWGVDYTISNGLLLTGLTLTVKPSSDGSIVVGGGGVGVGVLASDAQHGVRGGGTQHALAIAGTPGTAGFIGGVDIAALQSRNEDALANSMVLRDASGGTTLDSLSAKSNGALDPSTDGFIRALNEQTIVSARNTLGTNNINLMSVYQNALTLGAGATSTMLTSATGNTTKVGAGTTDMLFCTETGLGFFGAPAPFGGSGILTLNACTTIPTASMTGDRVNMYVAGGVGYGLAIDDMRTTVIPTVTGDKGTETRLDTKVARKNQTTGTVTATILDIPLGAPTATAQLTITLIGKVADATFARRRLVILNNQTPGTIVSTSTLGVDVDTIAGGIDAAFAIVGANYNIAVTSSTTGPVNWVVFVRIEYHEP